MRVFLTGASGYLGGILAQRLNGLPEVEQITGIALSTPDRALPVKMRFFRMDIRSPEVIAASAGHDVIVHTACVVLWSASMPAQERDEINFAGTQNIAKAARIHKVRRFVQASSMAAYDPESARGKTDLIEDFPLGNGRSAYYYWNAKAEAERILTRNLANSPTLLTLLRPIYIIGPGNRSVINRYRENAVNFPGQDPRRQFIHEDDVASAFVQALRTQMSGSFNVVPDDFIRLSDVWRIVGAGSVRTIPLWLARWITWARWRYFGSPIHSSWVADMLMDITGSNRRLKETGWQPHFRSAEALRTAL